MKSIIKESTVYDNCMDLKAAESMPTVANFIDDPTFASQAPKYKSTVKNIGGAYKSIYVSFRTKEDLREFANLIKQDVLIDEIWYPESRSLLFDSTDEISAYKFLDKDAIPKKPKKKLKPIADSKWRKLWTGMPEYIQEDYEPYHKIDMRFYDEAGYIAFTKIVQQNLSENTNSIWYPKLDRDANAKKRWVESKGNHTNPQYPLYIVSKGRADSRLTARSLERMQVPYYIAIEPQDYESYAAVIDPAKILVLPFSNHGDGPGRARNWCWDHAITLGAKRHWVLDDNISDFYRLHQNFRIRTESGAIFRAAEDFVDRFENVPISGFQYRFFIAPNGKYPAFVTNTRIYSVLLIDNTCEFRWRGRYNEDTDICLRVLKAGQCTIQFNSFLQGKAATQTLGGGNTAEFYAAEGTDPKSHMLYQMHPDVTTKVIRFGREHHYVDYNQFKKNKLIMKPDISIPVGINNYGMELITDFKG